MDKAEYQNEEYKADIDLIGMMTKPEEEEQRKNNQLSDNLTKAKEIIKNLLTLENDKFGNTRMDWRVKVNEEAEQFISEVEK